ncbi:MAG: glucokinase [Thermodesulfobacteriota bacterium]
MERFPAHVPSSLWVAPEPTLLLAADIGGTKANLALFRAQGGPLVPVREATVPTAAYPSAAALVKSFLGENPPGLAGACIGVAGPIRRGRVQAPNLPWTVAEEELAALGVPRVLLINDLVATAHGLGELPEDRFALLQGGCPDPEGNEALLAAGTGLGQTVLYGCGGRRVPAASEGGHVDFAPADEVQVELWRFLRARFGRVSVERVLSGPGLCLIHEFLEQSGRGGTGACVRERMARQDPAAVIAEEGLREGDPTCVAALDLFVRVYGAAAGNLALTALATAGVFLAGGIAPKILPKLREGAFLEAFCAKGRLAGLLEEVPVRVVLDPKAALYGAGRCAARAAGA